MLVHCTLGKKNPDDITYIFILKLFSQGLHLEPLSLIIIEGVNWVVGWGHTSGFIFLLQQTVMIHQH